MNMTEQCEINVHVREEVPDTLQVRRYAEDRCASTSKSFPELSKIEVSLLSEGDGFTVHAHATGKQTNVAVTHDWSRDAGVALNELLDRLESKLRRHHDKLWPAKHRKGSSKHHFEDTD
jgi:ribosome-associated translation inhibitor RaiA